MAYAILISEDEEIDLHNPMIDPYTNETVRPILIEGMPTLSARASAALRDDPTIIRYKAHQKDTGRFKLMRNMSLRYPIRVLRSWDSLGSGNLRPRGGVRYEGLFVSCSRPLQFCIVPLFPILTQCFYQVPRLCSRHKIDSII